MRPVFDEDRKDWEEIKKTNSDNAKKRWDKRVSEPMRPHTTECETMRASTDSVSGIDSVIVIDTTETISKDIGEQALVSSKKELVKTDNRNSCTQRIIDIVTDSVQIE